MADFDFDNARLARGRHFLNLIDAGNGHLQMLEALKEMFVAFKQEVAADLALEVPLVYEPGDLQFVNTKLLALKQAIQDFADSLGN